MIYFEGEEDAPWPGREIAWPERKFLIRRDRFKQACLQLNFFFFLANLDIAPKAKRIAAC